MERRFRWNLRQVLAAAAETARAVGEERGPRPTERAFIERGLEALRAFFAAVDAGIGALAQGNERPVLQKLTHIQIVWMEVHQ